MQVSRILRRALARLRDLTDVPDEALDGQEPA
jgi:hypothetical protein